MEKHRVEIRMTPEELKALDKARGREPRASYVKWAIAQAVKKDTK